MLSYRGKDLHQLYTMADVKRKQVVFLFTDSHVVNESFLENVNNILTSGVVPALFESYEKEQLMDSIREEVIASGQLDTPHNCCCVYINRCRDNIYVCLCFSQAMMT